MRVIEHSLFARFREDVNNVSLHTELYRGQYRLRQFLHNRVYTFLQQNGTHSPSHMRCRALYLLHMKLQNL